MFKTISILGGGQLGKMMLQEGLNLDISFRILDPDPQAPCSKLASEFVCGSLMDFETVYQFGKTAEVLTIEIEHVNVEALEKLEQEGVLVIPDTATLRIIQDKGNQKAFYTTHQIPTSEYRLCKDKNELEKNSDFFPVFQKLRKGGYDGKGVQKIENISDISKAFEEPSVLEKSVDVAKEIAVIVARDLSGNMVHFPPVEMAFDSVLNLVDYLFSPAQISSEEEEKCIEISRKVVEAFDSAGLFAVELFISKTGEILVNEIAPRVHNSGHHTIENCVTSQFEQLLRILLNLPLGSTSIIKPAAMVNLVGEPNYTGSVFYSGVDKVLSQQNTFIHLYGKKVTKSGRKMGHVTVLGETVSELKPKIDFVKKHLKVISNE